MNRFYVERAVLRTNSESIMNSCMHCWNIYKIAIIWRKVIIDEMLLIKPFEEEKILLNKVGLLVTDIYIFLFLPRKFSK